MRICKGDEYKEIKKLNYQKFFNEFENINNIIELIDSLEKKDKKDFMEGLMKECQFTKEEYYSNNENKKIDLLCELNEKKKIEKMEESNYYGNIEYTIDQIYKDLQGEILIEKLEQFLENEEKKVKKRLGLIKLYDISFDPETQYENLKQINEKIKTDIQELNSIKSTLLTFYRNRYQKEIRDIIDVINNIKFNTLKNYKDERTQLKISELKRLRPIVEVAENLKDFLFFKVLYNEAYGYDEEKRFNSALQKLYEIKELFERNASAEEIYQKNKYIFNKIKDILSISESKAEIFIEQMINYFKISEKRELINELTLIFKSKVYEINLKNIIYFFENLNCQDYIEDRFFEKIPKNLSELSLEDLKHNLKELKDKRIYDYEETNKNYKFFRYFYEKKEAIEYLLSKTDQDISALYNKLDPNIRTIDIEDIKDTEECIKIFNKFKKLYNCTEIFEYIINRLSEEDISKFRMYSKIYSSIIEFEKNDDSSPNLFNTDLF